jgi:hypothetical protein
MRPCAMRAAAPVCCSSRPAQSARHWQAQHGLAAACKMSSLVTPACELAGLCSQLMRLPRAAFGNCSTPACMPAMLMPQHRTALLTR